MGKVEFKFHFSLTVKIKFGGMKVANWKCEKCGGVIFDRGDVIHLSYRNTKFSEEGSPITCDGVESDSRHFIQCVGCGWREKVMGGKFKVEIEIEKV